MRHDTIQERLFATKSTSRSPNPADRKGDLVVGDILGILQIDAVLTGHREPVNSRVVDTCLYPSLVKPTSDLIPPPCVRIPQYDRVVVAKLDDIVCGSFPSGTLVYSMITISRFLAIARNRSISQGKPCSWQPRGCNEHRETRRTCARTQCFSGLSISNGKRGHRVRLLSPLHRNSDRRGES